MGKYFGTDGFRGEANIQLTVDHAFKVGRYVGWYYGRDHKAKIVIGKDTRRSSYMFEYALVAGLTASGIQYNDCVRKQNLRYVQYLLLLHMEVLQSCHPDMLRFLPQLQLQSSFRFRSEV